MAHTLIETKVIGSLILLLEMSRSQVLSVSLVQGDRVDRLGQVYLSDRSARSIRQTTESVASVT
jgi:hypothetical protein